MASCFSTRQWPVSKLRVYGGILFVLWSNLLFGQTPPNFKIAFIGDQGLNNDSRAVLNLIKSEGAQAVLHQGDFDYSDDPDAWEEQINSVLGTDFPYFASAGNHDEAEWPGYQQHMENRLNRLGIAWDGDLGAKSSLTYRGIFIILVAPGVDVPGSGHDAYIRERLAADNSIWSICSWHKNMEAMQVGEKVDETGWEVYEEATKGGAIIATGHEHSYSRTHLLSSPMNQIVVSRTEAMTLTKGQSFVFVSGLGGQSIREQQHTEDWWASVYTSDQSANYGALFGTFNVNGNPKLATFYFKDINGNIADQFSVLSAVEGGSTAIDETAEHVPSKFTLDQNYPNPFNPSTKIRFRLAEAGPTTLLIVNSMGQTVRTLVHEEMPAGERVIEWDARDDAGALVASGTYVYRLESSGEVQSKGLVFLK
ncbi:MAG: metallophosphoesterase [bacterium]